MKRYILLVFCILLGFVYFFIPLAYVEGVVGNGGAYGFGRYIEISNAKGDAVVMVALLTSLLSYFLIFAALLFRWIRAAKWLSVLALVSPVAAARFRKRRKLCRSVRLRFVECRVFYSLFDT